MFSLLVAAVLSHSLTSPDVVKLDDKALKKLGSPCTGSSIACLDKSVVQCVAGQVTLVLNCASPTKCRQGACVAESKTKSPEVEPTRTRSSVETRHVETETKKPEKSETKKEKSERHATRTRFNDDLIPTLVV